MQVQYSGNTSPCQGDITGSNPVTCFACLDWEDLDAGMDDNGYQKIFDYAWTVW